MNGTINKIAVAAAALALPMLALVPATSQASVLVTEWGYTVTSSFTHWTDTDGGSDGSGNVQQTSFNSGFNNKLEWSSDDSLGLRTSYIAVENTVENPPTLLTSYDAVSGNSVPGATFYHSNHTISNGVGTLSTATIVSQLTLKPKAPSGPDIGPLTLSFGILFDETNNLVPLGQCVGQQSTTPCDDIFVLGSVNGSQPTGSLSSSFIHDGYKYLVSLVIDGITTLPDQACIDVGADPGCVGLITTEGGENTFTTGFSISATKVVPAPGTLSILALGLLCLVWAGFSRRRRLD